MQLRSWIVLAIACICITTLASWVARARADATADTPCSLPFDIACTFLGGRDEDPDVRRISAQIDDTEAAAVARLRRNPPRDFYHQIVLLGKLELYDKSLSVNKNVACVSCHVPQTGFVSGVELYNRTIVAQPGSVPITNAIGPHPNWRIDNRRPMTYSYAPFSQILHYISSQQQFVGGNFWDMRATGYRFGNPAADQAADPPVDPLELANPDSACVVYSLSKAPYRRLFEEVWGAQSFSIHWPGNVEKVCSIPASSNAQNPTPLRLSKADRGTSDSTYGHFAAAIAANEASPEVSPFSSKFDAFLAGKAQLNPSEKRGYRLFNGQGKCDQCHVDGSTGDAMTIRWGNVVLAKATGPLFTNETSFNLGIPKNDFVPYLYEDRRDQFGFKPNPAGPSFVDLGVGAFLDSPADPNRAQWGRLAPQFDGEFAVVTLRNVDKRPYPGFVKDYFHNGFAKSLKEVVHFYNTRDVLPACPRGDTKGIGKSCWPPPEYRHNVTQIIGNLGLTDKQEDDIVAFLRTLTDGYSP